MPLPALDPLTGLLPIGEHPATLAEVRAMFGSANDVRTEIMDGLDRVAGILRTVGVFSEIFVDGSFVTSKPDPGDVDVCAPMDDTLLIRFMGHPRAMELADAELMKSVHKVQLFLGPRGVSLIPYFKGLKTEDALLRGVPATTKRGIIKVTL